MGLAENLTWMITKLNYIQVLQRKCDGYNILMNYNWTNGHIWWFTIVFASVVGKCECEFLTSFQDQHQPIKKVYKISIQR